MRLLLAAAAVATAIGSFVIWFIWAPADSASAFGLVVGLISAVLWALGSIFGAPWNARLNLFAALLAAGSLGFLAPAEKVCALYHAPLVCR